MILKVLIEDQSYALPVPEEMVYDAEEFFDRLDSDMSKGWQMSREWVQSPDTQQRCQIVADRLLTALEAERRPLAALYGAYIVSRMPGVTTVRIDHTGDMQGTEFSAS